MTQRKFIVTPALPYANGPLHLGHMVEHVQVNIFTRAMRLFGHKVLCICGADSHGTPIEMNAQKSGVSPVDFVAQWREAHAKALQSFQIDFDGGYGSTHTKRNEEHAHRFYAALKKNDWVEKRSIEQLYDPEVHRFLSDRMLKGICPKCGAEEQYGGNCEVCGSTYDATELVNARSTLSDATPILKSSEHYFVTLGQAKNVLAEFVESEVLEENVRKLVRPWLENDLKDWDISRDAPYFGIPIPGAEDKYFYVWLDAPIGYVSLSDAALTSGAKDFPDGVAEDLWSKESDAKIVHFIGKDIVYFHVLFWPALLAARGFKLPSKICVHGMLTINGQKMSKSRGTFVTAKEYADALGEVGIEALRYYFATKLNGGIDDFDLNLKTFCEKVNADLVNNIVNIVSRCSKLLEKNFESLLCLEDDSPRAHHLIDEATEWMHGPIKNAYDLCDFSRVTELVQARATLVNQQLQESAPWKTLKDPSLSSEARQATHSLLSESLWIARLCLGALSPAVPTLAEKGIRFLTDPKLFSEEPSLQTLLRAFEKGQRLPPFSPLFTRIQTKDVEKVFATTELDTATAPHKTKGHGKPLTPSAARGSAQHESEEIEFGDFQKIDLRAARVVAAEDVEGADKLIALTLDVGPLGEKHVFSGLKPHVQPSELMGKTLVLVSNLKPRKMRFGVSEGMVLAAGEPPTLVEAQHAKPGDPIR